jgi:hypothetical protein
MPHGEIKDIALIDGFPRSLSNSGTLDRHTFRLIECIISTITPCTRRRKTQRLKISRIGGAAEGQRSRSANDILIKEVICDNHFTSP